MKYRQVKERLDDDWFEYLLGRYQAVKEELEFFEYAVGQLSGRLPEVVRDMVMEDMTWRALSEKYSVSEAMIGEVPEEGAGGDEGAVPDEGEDGGGSIFWTDPVMRLSDG